MPCPTALRAALARTLTVVLAGLVVLGVATGPASARASGPEAQEDPLLVHIDTMSPVLPRKGTVEIAGTVTNVSDDTYTRVNLHVFSSFLPLTDATTLAASAAIDPSQYVGPRVTEPGTFATVDLLEPGQSATFADSVPVELLGIPDLPGVYWIGVHAIGDGPTVRDEVADGRARTFIPRLPPGKRTQEASVIIALRNRVWFDPEGRVGGTARWARWLEEGGRLDAALDTADAAGTTPYSWLVDPAILVALKRLASGNPPRSLAPDPTVPGQEPLPPQTTQEPAIATPQTLTPSPPDPDSTQTAEGTALGVAAAAWLERFGASAGTNAVLTLPFGDLDLSAAVRHSPARYDEALARSAQVMAELGLVAQPALAPENDVLSAEAIQAAAPETTILLGDNAFVAPPVTANSVVRLLGHKIVITSTGAESGGPGPTAAGDPLALRQRLLSEAAIRLANRDTAPVVVTLPRGWQGTEAASFFSGLEEPWLDVVPVPDVASRSAAGVPARSLAYTETDVADELPAENFAAADRAIETAALLESVLTLQTRIEGLVRDESLVTLSQQHRTGPQVAARSALRIAESLRSELGQIMVEGPTSVTLSSDSGRLGATLVNGLDQPVTVRIEATTDGQLSLSGSEQRTLGPRTRSLVRFEAKTEQPGLHNVLLAVTSVDGTPLGSVDEIPIRAAGVSALIWIIMAVGALIFFVAIGFRLPRQVRARRAEQAAAADEVALADADDADALEEKA